MANGYDGDIKLSVTLSPTEAIESSKKLQKSIQDVFDKTSDQKLDSKFQKIQTSMSKTVTKAQGLQRAMDDLAHIQIPTDDYKEVKDQIDKSVVALDKLKGKMDKFLETGGSAKSRTFRGMQYDMAELENTILYAKGELQDLVDTGKAFKLGSDTQEYTNLAQKLGDVNNEMRTLIEAHQEETLKSQQASQSNKQLSQSNEQVAQSSQEAAKNSEQAAQSNSKTATTSNKVKSAMSSLAQTLKQGALSFANFVKQGLKLALINPVVNKLKSLFSSLTSRLMGVSTAGRNMGVSLGGALKKLAAYGLGITGLVTLFNKLRSAIADALKDMALMNGGMNQTNASLSMLQSSLNYLKGSLAAAFQPILTVVAPILSNFIDQIADVINAIGMMIAKLTGATSYFRAVKKPANYAASQSSGGSSSSKKTAEEKYQEAVEKAQKKYEKQMAAYEKKVAKAQEKADEKNAKSEAEAAIKNAKAQAKAEEKNAKAAEKYAKAQEKANRQLAGFDELNVLTTQDLEEYEEVQADVYEATQYEPTEYEMPELELPDREDFEDAISGGGGSGDPFGLEEVAIDLEDIAWNWDWLKKKAEEFGRTLADSLNNIVDNEKLASDIGHNIAEALNTGLHFVYGFVDQLDWRQLGRWLGTLIQEGIDTFEWDLLGVTIGETLNGLADTVLGFFDRYDVGSLGLSISTMLNNAIDTIDGEKIGTAVTDVLKAPLIELDTILTETNVRELGAKFKDFYTQVFESKDLNDKTLGQTIGQTLADALNAGFDLLLGADVGQLLIDLSKFINDIFSSAFQNVHWNTILAVLTEALVGAVLAAVNLVADLIVDSLIGLVDGILSIGGLMTESVREDLQDFGVEWKEGVKQDIDDTYAEISQSIEEGLGVVNQTVDENLTFPEKMEQAMLDLQDSMSMSETIEELNNDLLSIQETYGLTAEDIDMLIEQFYEEEEQLGIVTNGHKLLSEALKDTDGAWSDYIQTLDSSTEPTERIKIDQEALQGSIADVGTTAQETSNTVQTYIDDAATSMEEGAKNAEDYKDSAVESLNAINDAGDEVIISFDTLTEQLGSELEGLTGTIDTWYQQMIEDYFGYDVWYAMLQDNLLPALNDFMTVDFLDAWDTNMQDWWDNHVLVWFEDTKWDDDVYTPWETHLKNKWTTFMTNVSAALEEFTQTIEETYTALQDSTDTTWESIEETILNHMDTIRESVVSDCTEITTALTEVANSLAALDSKGVSASYVGTGSTSSRTSGGGSYTPRTSRLLRTFMPLPNIMHLEDSLGMNDFKFPELATGAVIPPNSRFLAVLGDQKSGTNIETPLDTMVEAFNAARGDEESLLREQNQILMAILEKEFSISSKDVFNAARTENNNFIKRTGRSAFSY